MSQITKCEPTNCPQKETCKRYLEKDGALVDFEPVLCNETNNYYWYWQTETNIEINKTEV